MIQMVSKEEKEKVKFEQRILKELGQKSRTSMARRRKGPLIGLIFFSIALWGAKLFTFFSPGTFIQFSILGIEIHFHHFHIGIIALALGIILAFFESPKLILFGNLLFGAGLGLIVDEYWLLLTFNETLYFTPDSYFISAMIGLGMTLIYALVTVGLLLYTHREKKFWDTFREKVKEGKLKLEI
jgi:hypothetical protein